MGNNKLKILHEVANYYARTLAEFGDTPRGVDWNGAESQNLRFEKLCKIIEPKKTNFSINDLGCGYGALLDYLRSERSKCVYHGVDICDGMIKAAKKRHTADEKASFITATAPDKQADYSVASGVFNVRQQRSDHEWFDYMQRTLDILDQCSSLGFAFNCLTSYSDAHKRRGYLYYADPSRLFDLCMRRYSRRVTLIHDYDLYEFTILIKKSSS